MGSPPGLPEILLLLCALVLLNAAEYQREQSSFVVFYEDCFVMGQ
jgi:hypothetical protein